MVACLAACAAPDGAEDPADEAAAAPPEDAAVLPSPDGAGDPTVGLSVGQRAPDFTLPDHEGVSRTLADELGQPVLVVGSAVW